jgi:hypothetical protein
MLYGFLADLVVVVHVAFILFVAVGGLLALRWPRLLMIHGPAVVYAAAIITIGFECPLTDLEKYFRRLAGQSPYAGGFIKHYLNNVIYPGSLTPYLRAVAAACIVVAYAVLLVRWLHEQPRMTAPPERPREPA